MGVINHAPTNNRKNDMKGKAKRVTKQAILQWLKTPEGKARLIILDMARAGIDCRGMNLVGRNLIVTAGYDPELHKAHLMEGGKLPDLSDAQHQRCWIIGILCRVLKARFTGQERLFLDQLYLVILEPDGSAREVALAKVADAIAFAMGKMTPEQFAAGWRVQDVGTRRAVPVHTSEQGGGNGRAA